MFKRLKPFKAKKTEEEYVWPKHSLICHCGKCTKEAVAYVNKISKKGKK